MLSISSLSTSPHNLVLRDSHEYINEHVWCMWWIFTKQSHRRSDLVETGLTDACSIALSSYDFAHATYYEKICVHLDVAQIWVVPTDNSTDALFLCHNNLIQMIIERCFVLYDKDGRKVLDISERSPSLFFFLFFPYEWLWIMWSVCKEAELSFEFTNNDGVLAVVMSC